MTTLSSLSFISARSTIRSSTVFSVISLNTRTCFFCPIRCARSCKQSTVISTQSCGRAQMTFLSPGHFHDLTTQGTIDWMSLPWLADPLGGSSPNRRWWQHRLWPDWYPDLRRGYSTWRWTSRSQVGWTRLCIPESSPRISSEIHSFPNRGSLQLFHLKKCHWKCSVLHQNDSSENWRTCLSSCGVCPSNRQ